MPYLTPAPNPDERSYQVDISHATLGGLTVTRGSGGIEATTDQLLQAFVDLITQAEDWSIDSALKIEPARSTITPS